MPRGVSRASVSRSPPCPPSPPGTAAVPPYGEGHNAGPADQRFKRRPLDVIQSRPGSRSFVIDGGDHDAISTSNRGSVGKRSERAKRLPHFLVDVHDAG